MIIFVLYIGSLPNLTTTWFPCERGRTLFILWSLGQRSSHCLFYKYNCWQQDRFRTITLVLYIGSLTILVTWLWKGKNPIYFGVIGSKVKVTITINIMFYRLIIYIDRRILWCTHFLFSYHKLHLMKWWWCPLCTRSTWLIGYSASSLKQPSMGRHGAPLGHILIPS